MSIRDVAVAPPPQPASNRPQRKPVSSFSLLLGIGQPGVRDGRTAFATQTVPDGTGGRDAGARQDAQTEALYACHWLASGHLSYLVRDTAVERVAHASAAVATTRTSCVMRSTSDHGGLRPAASFPMMAQALSATAEMPPKRTCDASPTEEATLPSGRASPETRKSWQRRRITLHEKADYVHLYIRDYDLSESALHALASGALQTLDLPPGREVTILANGRAVGTRTAPMQEGDHG